MGGIRRCLIVLVLLLSAGRAACGAWIVEWDLEDGWEEAKRLGKNLPDVQIFAASFNQRDGMFIPAPLGEWIKKTVVAPSEGTEGPAFYLTVVNDILDAKGKAVSLKDPDLITRLITDPETRAKHIADLLALLKTAPFAGLDLDYERIKDEDWPAFIDFCRELHAALSAEGKALRVVLEPKLQRLGQSLPEGPDYVIMGYNLFGGHSGPGPKANAGFIANLYYACQPSGVPYRLALSTGGFDWTGEGKARSLTEAQAAALAKEMKAVPSRHSASRYLVFNYTDKAGAEHEVWYADGHTMLHLRRLARAHGFKGVDIWRLGGNVPESIDMLGKSLPEWRDRPVSRTERPAYEKGRELRVSASASATSKDAAETFATIGAAIAAAAPGDTIVVDPGEYRENLRIDTHGLTITSPPGTETKMPVTVIAPPGAPALLDMADTLWRGIVFSKAEETAAAENLVVLVDFSGRFEHCRFKWPGGNTGEAAVLVTGGSPVFHASVFSGKGGVGIRAGGIVPDSAMPNKTTTFTYCRVEGFSGGLLLAEGDVDVRFANCVLTRNGVFVRGVGGYTGEVDVLNSVLYYNLVSETSLSAPPVFVSHSVHTPAITKEFWIANPLPGQMGVIVENSFSASPRFRDVGRGLAVGMGIDDSANANVWDRLTRMADEFGFKSTWAVNTLAADETTWAVARDAVARGHEVGSHTSSHTPVATTPPIAVAYYRPELSSASIAIAEDGALTVAADGETVHTTNIDDGRTVAALARDLERVGLRTTVSAYYSSVPAAFLVRNTEVDILFPKGNVGLAMDAEKFMSHELLSSLAALRENLPGVPEFVLVYPFSVSSGLAKAAIAGAGYVASRTNIMLIDQGIEEQPPTGGEVRMNVFGLPGWSLSGARNLSPDNSVVENVRVMLDYFKLRMSAVVFYSHGWNEFSEEEWRGLMTLLKDDPKTEVMTLGEMMRRFRARGTPVDTETVAYAPPPPGEDYAPLPGSPLRAAGKLLGLTADFSGAPVPGDAPPTIGLYQE